MDKLGIKELLSIALSGFYFFAIMLLATHLTIPQTFVALKSHLPATLWKNDVFVALICFVISVMLGAFLLMITDTIKTKKWYAIISGNQFFPLYWQVTKNNKYNLNLDDLDKASKAAIGKSIKVDDEATQKENVSDMFDYVFYKITSSKDIDSDAVLARHGFYFLFRNMFFANLICIYFTIVAALFFCAAWKPTIIFCGALALLAYGMYAPLARHYRGQTLKTLFKIYLSSKKQ